MSVSQRLLYAVACALLVPQLAFTAAALAAAATNHQLLVVTGGSMEPRYSPGDLVRLDVTRRSPAPGDVVTYRSGAELTTHRVVALHHIDGVDYVQTQGDANAHPDANLTAVDNILGAPVGVVAGAGTAVTFLSTGLGRLVTYGPLLLLLTGEQVRALAAGVRRSRPRPKADVLAAPASSTPLRRRRRSLRSALRNTLSWAAVAGAVALWPTTLSAALWQPTAATFGDAATSAGSRVTTDALQPPGSVELAVNLLGLNVVDWEPSPTTYIDGYHVYRSTRGMRDQVLVATVPATQTSYTELTALNSSVEYQVRAYRANWLSAPSSARWRPRPVGTAR